MPVLLTFCNKEEVYNFAGIDKEMKFPSGEDCKHSFMVGSIKFSKGLVLAWLSLEIESGKLFEGQKKGQNKHVFFAIANFR